MNQRTTTLAAGAIAVALVGGVAAISRGRRPPPLRPVVVYQRVVSAKPPGIDAVELQFLPPENRPKPDPDDDEAPIEYRVVDGKGRIYASAATSGHKPLLLSIPRAYGKPVVQPRLVALIEGEPPGSVDLAPFPPPVLRPLHAQRDSRLRAFHDVRDLLQGTFGREIEGSPVRHEDAVVVFRPAARLPKDECWDLRVLGTNIASGVTDPRGDRIAPGTPEVTFATFYAGDIEAVQTQVTRFLRKIVSEDVVIRGLRLKKKGDRFVFDLPKPILVANRLGLRLTLNPEDKAASSLEGSANFTKYRPSLSFSADDEVQMNIQQFGSDKLPWGQAGESKPKLFVQLLRPTPKELGLDDILPFTYLSINPPKDLAGVRRLPEGPFDLRLRLFKTLLEKLGSFEATIPVDPAP